jgi:flagellin-like hook-associated protein FlgL
LVDWDIDALEHRSAGICGRFYQSRLKHCFRSIRCNQLIDFSSESDETAGVDTQTIDTQLSQLQDQLQSISNSASFNGINLLVQTDPNTWSMQWTSSPAENVVTSFENDNGADTVGFTNLQLARLIHEAVFDKLTSVA